MRYAIFSDIHSNLEAFREALNYLNRQKIDRLICLGDIIGYGANPEACLALLHKIRPVTLAGNHDWALVGKTALDRFSWQAKEVLLWTEKQIKKDDLSFLKDLPLVYQENNFICVHGSLNAPEKFNYITSPSGAWLNFCRLNKQICFIGHTHLADAFCLDNSEILPLHKPRITIEPDKKYIINTGSIGQPRDNDPRLCFCVYDSEKKYLEYKRIEYNIKAAADKIKKNSLPQFLAQRLYAGI